MRFRSAKQDGFQVSAVSGVNTISFGISATSAAKKGLLGFAVKRIDPNPDTRKTEQYYMYGFKVFQSVIPQPDDNTKVSTEQHPVQSFVWDDFTAKPGHKYTYEFHPVRGKPKNLDHSAEPISIDVETEELFSDTAEHQVFFNRGVASSQAYTREFGNKKPDQLAEPLQQKALHWLSRDLDTAMLKFIDQVEDGDTLLGCFYEFHYEPVLTALRQKARKAAVRIIIDAKDNSRTDKDGKLVEAFPREANLKAIEDAGIPSKCIIERTARPSAIQHNKFMVWLKGKGKEAKPIEVWTGSTNLSDGGIHGQTNVGHWVRNESIAEAFRQYWKILKADPGATSGDDKSTTLSKNKEFRKSVEDLGEVPLKLEEISSGITPVYSPRQKLDVLALYADLVVKAEKSTAVTLAFGVSDAFKSKLVNNTKDDQIVFLLLEKEDKKNPRSAKEFIPLTARNNVYSAWGAYIDDPVYQWVRETNTARLKLNSHVAYIHSKFLLHDPLGPDPIVVTGSANFSNPSTTENDENMIVIRGDLRVADIYFTEFNRLWNHYYFRAMYDKLHADEKQQTPTEGSLFLVEDDSWTKKYAQGTLKAKRLALYSTMELGKKRAAAH
jgi:phosphatidylserine/phosphatidylglycerophosphate/cardiolipin synthase-like enzyme